MNLPILPGARSVRAAISEAETEAPGAPNVSPGPRWAAAAAIVSACLSFAGYLDPRLDVLAVLGLAFSALALLRLRSANLAALLGAGWALGQFVGYRWGADGPGHLMYDVSLVIDGDLNFANEWAAWGYAPRELSRVGMTGNAHGVGAALVWLPAFLVAHLYVLATSWWGGPYQADGMSAPYLGVTAATTAGLVIFAGRRLARWLDTLLEPGIGWLSVFAITLGSPLAYYAVIRPHMDHAPVFAFVALFLIALHHFRSGPTVAGAARTGALLGLAMLCRPQVGPLAVVVMGVVATMPGPKRERAALLFVAGGACALAFLPQMVIWFVLYGTFLTIPQPPGWLDWSSPARWSVLISADHGLFNWHPLLLVGLFGLLIAPRALRWVSGAGFFALVVATWVNGSAHDPAGSDAFGARRFDLMWPFFAVGLAVILSRCRSVLIQRPLAAMGVLLLVPMLWNIGLVRQVESGALPSSAPVEDVFSGQARELRHLAERVLFMVPEPKRSAIVYQIFFGRYAYENLPVLNVFDLGAVPHRMLAGGWSDAVTDEGGRRYRRAEATGACLRVPLFRPAELVGTWTLWSSKRGGEQIATTSINRKTVSSATLTSGWQELAFPMPAEYLWAGENTVCISFSRTVPGESIGGFVSRLTLP